MPYTINWIKGFFFLILALIAVFVIFIYFIINQSIPNYNKDYTLSEPFGSIEIIRDRHAVPHIFTDDKRDLFFGLGFAHAQDRLWQMMQSRRLAYGELSEIFGQKTYNIDDFMKRIDLKRLSSVSLQYQSQSTQEALESYASGVNAWLNLINKGSQGRGAPEFFLYGSPLKKWQPVDSLSILRLLGLQGSSQINEELLTLKTILKLKNNKAFDLFSQEIKPNFDINNELLTKYENISFIDKQQLSIGNGVDLNFKPIQSRFNLQSSNLISISPSITVKKGSLLAHDLQGVLTTPAKWMLARMEFPNGGVIGATIPGIPAILLGRNIKIAWGLGNVNADQIDLYIEELNPKNNKEFLTPSGYKKLHQKKAKVKIKNKDDIEIDLLWSDNGPIIPEQYLGVIFKEESKNLISIKSNSMIENDLSMTAAIDLMLSNSVNEALEVSKNHVTPIKNLMVIDNENIAFKLIGKIPKRNIAHSTKGQFPGFGGSRDDQWNGYYAYDVNTISKNPSNGKILNTGNKNINNKFPKNLTYKWNDTQKIQRLKKKMDYRDVYTLESLMEIHTDTVSYTARSLLGLIANDLWYEGEIGPSGSSKFSRQSILKKLSTWNGNMNSSLIEPFVYNTWLTMLQKRIIQDELGMLYEQYSNYQPLFLERVFKNINNASDWCDINQTFKIENCNQLAKDSLNDTLTSLRKKYGNNIENWKWGKYNKAVYFHNPLGKQKFLHWVFNISHNVSGGTYTLNSNKTKYSKDGKIIASHGSVFKGIYDMGDPNSSLYIISTGQSGHFLSRHYDDLSRLSNEGNYIPMSLDPIATKAGSLGVTRINY
ncbi:penicillin acylase family protein [Paracoccaceae bacterium]|nr:penicillin acylase family protein [Paracoccaceae bacterium]